MVSSLTGSGEKFLQLRLSFIAVKTSIGPLLSSKWNLYQLNLPHFVWKFNDY
jgi:hypothetical protein